MRSGTLLIEAAQKALNIAPGLKRAFAAEKYSFIPKKCLGRRKDKNGKTPLKPTPNLRHTVLTLTPLVLENRKKNADKAGVGKYIKFFRADVKKFEPGKILPL